MIKLKNRIFYILIFIFSLFVSFDVYADSMSIETEINNKGYYINVKGVKIEKDVFEKIHSYYDDNDLEFMGSASYNILKQNLVEDNWEINGVEEKYYETSYFVKENGIITNMTNNIISKNDYYERAAVDSQESCGVACWKTEYKALRMVDMLNGSNIKIMVENLWYKMPMIKK